MITADVQKLEPGSEVNLFEVQLSVLGGEDMRFHGHMEDGPIVFQGLEYLPWPIEAEGFARTGSGVQPAPTLRVVNVDSTISALCLEYDDLVGVRVIRRRTLAQYLDNQPTADPTQEFRPEIWLIEARTAEDKTVVEFELQSALNFEGMQLPNSEINATMCRWLVVGGYRGAYCNYTGSAMFDRDGNPTIDPAQDRCGGRVSDCKKRFGEYEQINIDCYPAADMIRGY